MRAAAPTAGHLHVGATVSVLCWWMVDVRAVVATAAE
jgi:hypothetical protein